MEKKPLILNKINVYKPRYKIAFQAKNKIWAYKNSHLRHFFSIRCKRLYRDGYFRKNVLVATTMKWTIARRFIRPARLHVKPRGGKSRYRNTFYLKQQVRQFYGKLTEVAFRSIYKTHMLNTFDRNKSFFGSLEQRADMFLFRMRLLPTIYACNQFVHHQGLLLNNKRLEKCPSALIKIGYTISLPKKYWHIMSNYMIQRVYFRVFGKFVMRRRLGRLFKRKLNWLRLRRFKYRRSFYSIWRSRLIFLKMIASLRKIIRVIRKLLRKFWDYVLVHRYIHNPRIQAALKRMDAMQTQFPDLFFNFVFLYSFFWKNIAKVKNSKQSPRVFMLFLLKNYALFRDFRHFFLSFKECYSSCLYLVSLEQLKTLEEHPITLMRKFKIPLEEIKLARGPVEESDEEEEKLSKEEEEKKVTLVEVKDYLKKKWSLTFQETSLFLQERYRVEEEAKYLYLHIYIKSLFLKYTKRSRPFFDKLKKKHTSRPLAVLYYLISLKYKQRRKRQLIRFKKVHWYIPRYIYFDVKTLRGTLIYVPRAKEIVLPFRCSLFKIFSFYKSLGY